MVHPVIPRSANEKKLPVFFDNIGEPQYGDLGRWIRDDQYNRVWIFVANCINRSKDHWCCPEGTSRHHWIECSNRDMRRLQPQTQSLQKYLRKLTQPHSGMRNRE